jgi:arylsulfatase
MVELDGYVGQLLAKLDDLDVADNTVVVFTTDNGAEVMSWPDGGSTPFRGEKGTNWEGGWRIPCVMRWPGVIEPGRIINEICSLQDFIPTFAAAAGEADLVQKVKKGYGADGRKFKVHLDGVNLMPFLKGDVKKSPREGFLYWNDDGELVAIRVGDWKANFMEQRSKGLAVWREPFSPLRLPKLFNLRTDPFETGDEALFYGKWSADRLFLLVPAQKIVGEWLESFKEFPIRQKPASFSVDDVMEKLFPKAA